MAEMTPEQVRMFTIGFLTAAANALTMQNEKADRFAGEKLASAVHFMKALGVDV